MPDQRSDIDTYFTSSRATALLQGFDPQGVPAHVAIIMDGNGRWAQARRKPRVAGHRAGAKALREAIETSLELGIRYLTIYSFSSENWNRAPEEVSGLMRLFVEVLQAQLDSLCREGVRLRLVGDREQLPGDVLTAFEEAERSTAENDSLELLVALNYGGRREIVRAAGLLAEAVASGGLAVDQIDEERFAAELYTAPAPDPDLVIRTSGELRVSNFLLWQIAYSELYVTDVLWPDFTRDDLLEAAVEYQKRQRRYGA